MVDVFDGVVQLNEASFKRETYQIFTACNTIEEVEGLALDIQIFANHLKRKRIEEITKDKNKKGVKRIANLL